MINFFVAVLKYGNDDRIKYQLYAEFLRLAGIYIWEQCIAPDEYLRFSDSRELMEGFLSYTIPAGSTKLGAEKQVTDTIQGELLDVLKHEWQEQLAHTEYEEAYQLLKDLYINNRLFEAGMTLQYFRVCHPVIEAAGRQFEAAAEQLTEKIHNGGLQNRYLNYARLYCLQKANYAYLLCRKPVAVYVDILADECMELIEECPDFSNAWVLLGMIYENAENRILESIDAFEKALNLIEALPFVSSIYYWIGKRCESYPAFRNKMQESYNKAYRLDRKYRIIYKKAMMSEREDKWDQSIQFYEECLEKLSIKGDYLDPLEQEYYFKVYIRIGYIYLNKFEDSKKCIEILNKAVSLKENVSKGLNARNSSTAFYYDVYGLGDAEKYIRIELGRMSTKQLYRYLSRAYENLENWDMSRECWDLSEE